MGDQTVFAGGWYSVISYTPKMKKSHDKNKDYSISG